MEELDLNMSGLSHISSNGNSDFLEDDSDYFNNKNPPSSCSEEEVKDEVPQDPPELEKQVRVEDPGCSEATEIQQNKQLVDMGIRRMESEKIKGNDLETNQEQSDLVSQKVKMHDKAQTEDLGVLVPLFDCMFCVSNSKVFIQNLVNDSLKRRGNNVRVGDYDIDMHYYISYLTKVANTQDIEQNEIINLTDTFEENEESKENSVSVQESLSQICNNISENNFTPLDIAKIIERRKATKNAIKSKTNEKVNENKPFLKIRTDKEYHQCDNSMQELRMNLSYESEEHNIYSPKFSSSLSSDEKSSISIDQQDEMNAKNDPLFDAHSIEEIKIYSNYPQNVESEANSIEKDLSQAPGKAVAPPIRCESPHIRVDLFPKKEESGSVDNTYYCSTTIPSFNFSFKYKNLNSEGMSLLHSSRRQELPSTLQEKTRSEELRDSMMNPNTSASQSRNICMYEGKLLINNSAENFKRKSKINPRKLEFHPDKISEYSAKTYSQVSANKEKINESLKTASKILKNEKIMRNLKKSSKANTDKATEKSKVKLKKMTSYTFKYGSSKKASYKAIAERNKTRVNSIIKQGHKYNKSHGNHSKKLTKESKILRKNYTNYLTKADDSRAKRSQRISKLESDYRLNLTKKLSLNYTSTNGSKFSDNSSVVIHSETSAMVKASIMSDEGGKFVSSPKFLKTPKTMKAQTSRMCPAIFSYNINSLKKNFKKVRSINKKTQKNLDNRLQKLVKKNSTLASTSRKKTFLKSKYLQIQLDREKAKVTNNHDYTQRSFATKPKKKYSNASPLITSLSYNDRTYQMGYKKKSLCKSVNKVYTKKTRLQSSKRSNDTSQCSYK
ncbi:unnamed protein product [Moneuplotes crassus]|uniref:Uncharacterized protein n=1 Tax=Euplotes crassus TaxID=5936 RepID=A0AAD1Y460_EUPCR|nr:unnamed protein product [Moneuplotes crassus]